jgi:hypothetical protein
MDPRYYTNPPLPFKVKSCGISQQSNLNQAIDRRNSLAGQLGKIGDLEVWNELGTGGGSVGQGLRTLAKISNSVRTGDGAIPSQLGNGVNWVLDTLGLNSAAINVAKDLNPTVANNALGQAKVLYEKISQGKLHLTDIPTIFQDMQEMERLLGGIITPSGSPTNATGVYQQCGASPYAMDLFNYAPKYKFLFVVQIEYTEGYQGLRDNNIAFVVKTSSRPEVEYEMEDLNMYNFHTKVTKRTNYGNMDMTFYDDDRNQAMLFYTAYMKAMSPVANMHFDQKISDTDVYGNSGMDFGGMGQGKIYPGPTPTNAYSASVGSLNGPNTKTIIKQITLYHLYRQGRLMNIYKFYNPRITQLQLDELDMSSNDVSGVNIQFAYDGLFVIPGYQVNPQVNKEYNLTELTRGGLYPLQTTNFAASGDETKDDNSVTGQQLVSSLGNGNNDNGIIPTAAQSIFGQPGDINWGNVAHVVTPQFASKVETVVRDANTFTNSVTDINANRSFVNTLSKAFTNPFFNGSEWSSGNTSK